jgi:hypothetical protein
MLRMTAMNEVLMRFFSRRPLLQQPVQSGSQCRPRRGCARVGDRLRRYHPPREIIASNALINSDNSGS